MKRKIALVIGASTESIYAIKTAQKNNFFVIAFDENPKAAGFSYANKSYNIDIKDSTKIIECLGDIVPDVILPIPIGRYLITSGFLNEYFNLKGPSNFATNVCTDKYLFNKKLSAAGLKDVPFILIPAGKSNNINFKNIRFPLIAKPRFGSGNRGVQVFQTKEELKCLSFQNIRYNEDFIIEEFVSGIEYGVDCAVINNKFYIVLVREKKLRKFPETFCVGYYSVVNNSLLISRITTYLENVVSVLKINDALIHCDLLISKGKIFIIELSPRPSGHYLHNKFTIYATGIDMVQEYLNYINGKEYNFNPLYSKNLLIRFFDFDNCIIKKIPVLGKLEKHYKILDYVCNLSEGFLTTIESSSSLINRGYFILEANNRDKLDIYSEEILNCFKEG